ncbi:MAG: transcription antitermination factor NusB [Actinomycetales bacterium]|nr:transcription antitermination factor NusB [Actinomycetales bacterium]
MPARSKARKRALDILYEADMRGQRPSQILAGQVARRAASGDAELNAYVSELIEGVSRNLERIDELIGTYAVGWSLDRMPAVDRAILRLAAYEVLWRDDIPDPVAIAEAVGLAERLSTDDSAAFVNGLLGRLSDLKPRLGIEADPQPDQAPTASSPPG